MECRSGFEGNGTGADVDSFCDSTENKSFYSLLMGNVLHQVYSRVMKPMIVGTDHLLLVTCGSNVVIPIWLDTHMSDKKIVHIKSAEALTISTTV